MLLSLAFKQTLNTAVEESFHPSDDAKEQSENQKPNVK